MSDVLIKLRRNGQKKGFAVVVDDWEELEERAHQRFDDLHTHVGPLEFRDESHQVVNEFRVPLTNYSRENIWACIPGESWVEAPPPYRCNRCGDTLMAHNCRGYPRPMGPMLPVEAVVIVIEKLFASKKS